MSDILSTLTDSDLANQITQLVTQMEEAGEYVTVRFAAKKLNVKQPKIRDNLPAKARLLPSKNGTLGESRIQLNAVSDDEVHITDAESDSPENTYVAREREVVQPMLPRKSRRTKVETEKVVEQEFQLDEDGNQILDEEGNPIPVPAEESGPTVICVVCGNPVRKTSIVRRGVCPLCFRQLARNVGKNATQLEALSDEEFEVILGEELSRRRTLEEYKASRQLTPEEFKEREADLVPVKQVFAAAKEAGYGPGRVAQAMGGDRFRHEPLGGFGSVWTPYFVGPRKGWYFEKSILESFDQLAKPVKEKKTKINGEEGEGAVGRKGARGAKMTPVVEDETQELEASQASVE